LEGHCFTQGLNKLNVTGTSLMDWRVESTSHTCFCLCLIVWLSLSEAVTADTQGRIDDITDRGFSKVIISFSVFCGVDSERLDLMLGFSERTRL